RGTPGTEVAYLLRVLLDRIGLAPDSDQLRIIASSASLDDGPSGRVYLEQFFGRDRNRFYVERGTVLPPDPTAIRSVRAHTAAFRAYGRNHGQGAIFATESGILHEAVGCAPPRPQIPPERLLDEAAVRTRLAEALRAACYDGHGLVPKTPRQLADH